jgi:hypothetical protein
MSKYLKEGFDVIIEELHIYVKVNPTQTRIGRLHLLYISYIEKSE